MSQMLARRSGRTSFGIAVVFALIILAGATSAAQSASRSSSSTWRVVKSKTASGTNPILTISAAIRHPHGIAVRGSSPQHVGSNIYWNCTKGFLVRQWSTDVVGARLYPLPHVRGTDSCRVFVAAHGRERITVTIYKAA